MKCGFILVLWRSLLLRRIATRNVGEANFDLILEKIELLWPPPQNPLQIWTLTRRIVCHIKLGIYENLRF